MKNNKDYQKQYRLDNAETIKQQKKEWNEQNKEEVAKKAAEYYANNKDKIKAKKEESLKNAVVDPNITHKICRVCKIDKELSNFGKHKTQLDGLRRNCKECEKQDRINRATKISESQKKYYVNNQDKVKSYREEHKEEHKIYAKQDYLKNKEYYAKINKIRYDLNRDDILRKNSEYQKNNREKLNAKRKIYEKERKSSDINFRLAKNLRNRLGMALKNNYKSGSAVQDLGCSIEELKKYLESLFEPGMNWNNYGNKENQWSIDHIIALSLVDLTDREQFLKVCNYKNLRPMWHIANIKKSNNII